jgi:hypothetical protein
MVPVALHWPYLGNALQQGSYLSAEPCQLLVCHGVGLCNDWDDSHLHIVTSDNILNRVSALNGVTKVCRQSAARQVARVLLDQHLLSGRTHGGHTMMTQK